MWRNLAYYRQLYLVFSDGRFCTNSCKILLGRTSEEFSVLHESEQLFAAKYMTYMPTEEELRREIEQQKQFFLEQQRNKATDTDKE